MSFDPEEQAYHKLCAYTLTHGDPSFIHQHVVDAFAAQRADEKTKPIGVTFALVGLYLHVEHRWTGREVQRAHMALAREKHPWPQFVLPDSRGSITPSQVLAAPAGPARDEAIHRWCTSVWEALKEHRASIATLLAEHAIYPK
jgi:hypothetical protein